MSIRKTVGREILTGVDRARVCVAAGQGGGVEGSVLPTSRVVLGAVLGHTVQTLLVATVAAVHAPKTGLQTQEHSLN